MNNIEKNALIAEFMGANWWPKQKWWQFNKFSEAYEFEGVSVGYAPEQLKYDTSWGWLMSVVEKIERMELVDEFNMHHCSLLGFTTEITNAKRDKYFYIRGLQKSRFEATYEAVFEFVKWYNTLSC